VYALFIFTYVLIGCQLIPAANAQNGGTSFYVDETTGVSTNVTTVVETTVPVTTVPPTTTAKPTEPTPTVPKPTEPEVTVSTQPTTPIVPTSPPVNNAPVRKYYDVPLSEDLQSYIFELCESYGVDPSIIVAMIYRESTFKASAVGDNGNSFGLMQIQPRWFQQRMAELGITDLLDPYQNVTLGIDYVAELMASGKSIQWVLMAYNGGPVYADQKAAEGVVTEYAETVIEYSWGLKR
jgi:hypothetical protein